MGSISHHIMALVINSLGDGYTHKHTYRRPHRNNFKKPVRPAHTWFKIPLFLLQSSSMKVFKIHYVTANRFMCVLGQTNLMLQELWIFFACVRALEKLEHMSTTVTWKTECWWRLAPLMPYGLKYLPCSTEWIDEHYKHICENILMVWNHLFMNSTRTTEYTETPNSQNLAIKPAYFIIWLQV